MVDIDNNLKLVNSPKHKNNKKGLTTNGNYHLILLYTMNLMKEVSLQLRFNKLSYHGFKVVIKVFLIYFIFICILSIFIFYLNLIYLCLFQYIFYLYMIVSNIYIYDLYQND